MRSFRSKPIGWRGESYRHYLAAKGVYAARKPRLKSFEQSQLRRVRGERRADELEELMKTSVGKVIMRKKTDIPEDVQIILSKTARVKKVGVMKGDPESVVEEKKAFDFEEFLSGLPQQQSKFPTKHERIRDEMKMRVEEQQRLRDERLKVLERVQKDRVRREQARQQLEEFMRQFEEKDDL